MPPVVETEPAIHRRTTPHPGVDARDARRWPRERRRHTLMDAHSKRPEARSGEPVSAKQALEAHLRSHPEDWESWLVYADALTEEGDIRGEIIALKHRLHQGGLSNEERLRLQEHIGAIEEAHASTWLPKELTTYEMVFDWRFGFVIKVWLLCWHDDTLRYFEALVAHPSARFLTALDLLESYIDADGIRALGASRHLCALTELNLLRNPIGTEGRAALESSAYLRRCKFVIG